LRKPALRAYPEWTISGIGEIVEAFLRSEAIRIRNSRAGLCGGASAAVTWRSGPVYRMRERSDRWEGDRVGSAGAALLLFVVADAPPPLYATADEVI